MTQIEHFVLPYSDWYDEEGRIYKDVLIKNFDAIEQKIIELQGLDAFDVVLPDISTIVYPDTDLTSEDNCIINLKSFIEIMNLVNYPIECDINGITVRKVAYYDDSYNYRVIQNVTLNDASDSKQFIVIDTANQTVKALASYTPADDIILIGKFINGSIVSIYDKAPIKLNLLNLLASMNKNSALWTRDGGANRGTIISLARGGGFGYYRSVGAYSGESKSSGGTIHVTDSGWEE